MRDIKFRAWHKSQKQYFTGLYLSFDGKIGIWNNEETEIEFANYDYLILEQYTGLKDKNGKALDWWEGDLLREDGGEVMEVVYEDGCFWGAWLKHREHKMPIHILLGWIDAIEKVGNIHENGDLL